MPSVFGIWIDVFARMSSALDVDDRDVVHTSMGKREAGGWSFSAV